MSFCEALHTRDSRTVFLFGLIMRRRKTVKRKTVKPYISSQWNFGGDSLSFRCTTCVAPDSLSTVSSLSYTDPAYTRIDETNATNTDSHVVPLFSPLRISFSSRHLLLLPLLSVSNPISSCFTSSRPDEKGNERRKTKGMKHSERHRHSFHAHICRPDLHLRTRSVIRSVLRSQTVTRFIICHERSDQKQVHESHAVHDT